MAEEVTNEPSHGLAQVVLEFFLNSTIRRENLSFWKISLNILRDQESNAITQDNENLNSTHFISIITIINL